MSPAAAERIYRLLLRAYPPDFRAEYGREMVLLFRDQCRRATCEDSASGRPSFAMSLAARRPSAQQHGVRVGVRALKPLR